jgi:hypothetical protein
VVLPEWVRTVKSLGKNESLIEFLKDFSYVILKYIYKMSKIVFTKTC